MSGKEILIDTNIALYLLNGSEALANMLQGKDVYISFITELELIGYKNITESEEKRIAELIDDCSIIALNNSIKHRYKEIRRNYSLKLADAIIAATSLTFDIPLITADKQFQKIEELNLIAYQPNL